MKTLKLNKETILQMEKNEMSSVNGGLNVCVVSCANGSRKGKKCCETVTITIGI